MNEGDLLGEWWGMRREQNSREPTNDAWLWRENVKRQLHVLWELNCNVVVLRFSRHPAGDRIDCNSSPAGDSHSRSLWDSLRLFIFFSLVVGSKMPLQAFKNEPFDTETMLNASHRASGQELEKTAWQNIERQRL